MSSGIRTYEDLLVEEKRLMASLKEQEALIREDIAGIREKLKPVRKVMQVLNKMTSRDHTGPLSSLGIDLGIDVLVRRLILARAGWFTKIIIPFFLKNYSSHIISEETKAKLSKKIQAFFEKIRPKKKKETADAET